MIGQENKDKILQAQKVESKTTLIAQLMSGYLDPSAINEKKTTYEIADYNLIALSIYAHTSPQDLFKHMLESYDDLRSSADKQIYLHNALIFIKALLRANLNSRYFEKTKSEMDKFINELKPLAEKIDQNKFKDFAQELNLELADLRSIVDQQKNIKNRINQEPGKSKIADHFKFLEPKKGISLLFIRARTRENKAKELADDLMQVQLGYLKQIELSQLHNQNFAKKKHLNLPITQMTSNYNKIIGQVMIDILTGKNQAHQKEIYNFYIEVMNNCLNNRDYLSAQAILGALQHTSISNIVKIDFATDANKKILNKMNELFSINSNRKKLREDIEMIKGENKVFIPFIPMLQSDLTFIDDGNPDVDKTNNKINEKKLHKEAAVIKVLYAAQQIAFKEDAKPLKTDLVSRLNTTPFLDEIAYSEISNKNKGKNFTLIKSDDIKLKQEESNKRNQIKMDKLLKDISDDFKKLIANDMSQKEELIRINKDRITMTVSHINDVSKYTILLKNLNDLKIAYEIEGNNFILYASNVTVDIANKLHEKIKDSLKELAPFELEQQFKGLNENDVLSEKVYNFFYDNNLDALWSQIVLDFKSGLMQGQEKKAARLSDFLMKLNKLSLNSTNDQALKNQITNFKIAATNWLASLGNKEASSPIRVTSVVKPITQQVTGSPTAVEQKDNELGLSKETTITPKQLIDVDSLMNYLTPKSLDKVIPPIILDLAIKGNEFYKRKIAEDPNFDIHKFRVEHEDWMKYELGSNENKLRKILENVAPPPTFTLETIQKLQEKYEVNKKAKNPTLKIVTGGFPAQDLAKVPLGNNCFVQVASQFDLQESMGPYDTAVSDYPHDSTQGPFVAVQAPSACMQRKANKFASDQRKTLDHTLVNFLDLKVGQPPQNILKKYPKLYKDGYLDLSVFFRPKENEATQQEHMKALDALSKYIGENIDKLPVLAQHVICSNGATQIQVFAAAPSFQNYTGNLENIHSNASVLKICEDLVVAQYKAIAHMARATSLKTGKREPLHLTMVGQSAFKNPESVMGKAIEEVMKIVKGSNVDVYINAYSNNDEKLLDNQIKRIDPEMKKFNIEYVGARRFREAKHPNPRNFDLTKLKTQKEHKPKVTFALEPPTIIHTDLANGPNLGKVLKSLREKAEMLPPEHKTNFLNNLVKIESDIKCFDTQKKLNVLLVELQKKYPDNNAKEREIINKVFSDAKVQPLNKPSAIQPSEPPSVGSNKLK
ncbi:MAG: hypothetical protein JSS07_03635 [Proteobacteria bacterium]|nr:hypothetical protein [Pseudomonadota bacterium]